MRAFLKAWLRRVLRQWYLAPIIILYKLAEDRMLAWANTMLDRQKDGIGDVVSSVLPYVPSVTWTVMPLTAAVLLLFTWRTTRQSKLQPSKQESRDSPITSTHPPEEEQSIASPNRIHADWLLSAIGIDPEHLDLRILFRDPYIYWHGVGKALPFLEIRFFIANRAKFVVVVEAQTSNGYLHYQDQSLMQRAEIREELRLQHSIESQLIITQSIDSNLIKDLGNHLGAQVVFDLSTLGIKVKAQFPDGADGPNSTLKLPSPLLVTVPEQGEWESYFEMQDSDAAPKNEPTMTNSPTINTSGNSSPVNIEGSFNTQQVSPELQIPWRNRPGGPQFKISNGVYQGQLICSFEINATPAPGGVEARWVGGGTDMDWTTPMNENVPSGATYKKYQMKPASMNPNPPTDEIAFEVRFYLADGLHGGRWLWSLRQHPKGHWQLENHEGSGVFQPSLEDTW